MQIVIMAGGLGTRLMPLTKNLPKPMVPIKNKPFLEYLIVHLRKNGFKNFLLCTGYLSHIISEYFGDGEKFGVNITYSVEDEPLDTGGALRKAEKFLNEEFMLMNGDTFVPVNYKELIAYYRQINNNVIVINSKSIQRKTGNISIGNNNQITKYDKEKNNLEYNDCGIQIFRKGMLNLIPKFAKVALETEVFPQLISKSRLYAFIINQRFFDIGTSEDLITFEGRIDDYIKDTI